jgi:wyosine [tRNA(Phe)-imidazoG37] synthetase (radical SAM superfamily)
VDEQPKKKTIMSTFLFDKTVFGPVISRRLGVSLGINLLPNDQKLCNFNCIYCECGWNPSAKGTKPKLPSREEVFFCLEEKLISMSETGQFPDVITFAGNGEPTLHPDFYPIIMDTIDLRNLHAPKARVAVLSNSTLLHKSEVIKALKLVDDNILKLDSGKQETIRLLNAPHSGFNLEKLIGQLLRFEGKLTIQTLFVTGYYKNQLVDNTTPEEIELWLNLLERINPSGLMIYTIDRDTAAHGLKKVSLAKLQEIALLVKEKLKIKVDVSG